MIAMKNAQVGISECYPKCGPRRQRRYMEGEGTPPGGTPPKPPEGGKFDQKFVDDLIGKTKAELTRKFDGERAQILERMKALETDAGRAADLENQIAELNNRYKSKEELAADSYKKEKATWEGNAKKAAEERDAWQGRWFDTHRDTELMAAASTKEADVKSVEQVLMILQPRAKVKQKVVEGKPVDAYETRIAFPVVKEGKTQVLDLSPSEALKVMKDDVPRFGNLFNSSATGGLGGSGPAGSPGNDTLLGLSQEEFTKRYLEGKLPKRTK